jgi:hypothetical protein
MSGWEGIEPHITLCQSSKPDQMHSCCSGSLTYICTLLGILYLTSSEWPPDLNEDRMGSQFPDMYETSRPEVWEPPSPPSPGQFCLHGYMLFLTTEKHTNHTLNVRYTNTHWGPKQIPFQTYTNFMEIDIPLVALTSNYMGKVSPPHYYIPALRGCQSLHWHSQSRNTAISNNTHTTLASKYALVCKGFTSTTSWGLISRGC